MKQLQMKCNDRYWNFWKTIFTLSLLLLMEVGQAKAQDSLDVIQGSSSNTSWLKFSDSRFSLYHYLTSQAYAQLDKRRRTIAKLSSISDWKARQQLVRQTLRNIIGPFPEKTLLNARVTKTIVEDGYRIENVIYQSQPDFYVTSSLFIPNNLDKPGPAVIYTSGHTKKGYRNKTYQHVILNLVKKGFIVFAFDPVGQGERLQYYDLKNGQSIVGGSTNEHSYAGAQAFITGSSEAFYFIWDGIRAVDYLLSRKEVDPDRIGITGRSGGGTQSAYIGAMDDRIYAAAPESYITSFRRLLESIGPQDAEQNLPGEIAAGLDHADLLEVRAPKPTVMLTTTRGFFSIQGARETACEVAHIYNAYDKSDQFGMVEDDAVHRSTKKNREAMYGFFQKQLNNPGSPEDEDVELLVHHELQVTRTGQVASSLGGETIFSLNRKQAKREEKALQAGRKDLSGHLPKAVKAAKKLSGYRAPDSVATPVFTGRFQKEGYSIEKYYIKGEGDYPIPYLLLVPDKPSGKGLIYLDPAGKANHLGQQEELVRRGVTILVPDLLGVGEMGGSGYQGDSYIEDTSYNTFFASILIGRSIVGIQAGDVLRLTHLLQNRVGIKEVYGLARRQMGPVLLHAAAFDSSLARIALIKSYSSYRSIVMKQFYKPSFISSTVAGALQEYDLPDLAASLAPRKLLVVDLNDGTGAYAQKATVLEDTAVIKTAFKRQHAGRQLNIRSGVSAKDIQLFVENWIK